MGISTPVIKTFCSISKNLSKYSSFGNPLERQVEGKPWERSFVNGSSNQRKFRSRVQLETVEVLTTSEAQENGAKFTGPYAEELKVATKAVQLACQLSGEVQRKIRVAEEGGQSKADKSPVTIADWGVQAVVSWVLEQSFPSEPFSMIAEEDTSALTGRAGFPHLARVISAVNSCLEMSPQVGLPPPRGPLDTVTVLKAIQRGSSNGGPKGRHWILDPIDGTLGFLRGDQYAIALAMIEDGKVVLGVLGCPNFPTRTEWLRHPHRYHRITEKIFPPPKDSWHRGVVLRASQGGDGVWMEPLVLGQSASSARGAPAHVSSVEDPGEATFCEPVEKANSNQEFSQGVAQGIGLRKLPLRVYSMAKYAAIARGDAEVFMKFARGKYKEKVWDHAAGAFLVEEAGGVVTDAGGRPLDFSKGRFLDGLDRGIIASCNEAMHSQLLRSVDDSWASSRL